MSNSQQTYLPSGNIHPLSTQLLDTDKAQTTASVIHGRCKTGGHDEFVDVKVSHSGALKIESEVVNSTGTIINPATEEGIQEVVTAIENISIPAPVGGATSSNQEINNQLVDALYELIARLDFLPSIRGVSADLRTTVVGGNVAVTGNLSSLGTVTTVTTVGNQSSLGGYNAAPLVSSQVNMNAAISNINNITVGT